MSTEVIKAAKFDPAFRAEVAGLVKGFDFGNCLACGMCTAGCVYSDVHADNDPRKFLRKLILGMREEAMNDPYYWMCTMCERCTIECPMGINVAAIVRSIRGTTNEAFSEDPAKKGPGFMVKVVEETIESGNQMNVSQEDFLDTIEWIEEELQAELEDPDYKVPLDVEGADFIFGFNAREIKYYPQELQSILKIFYAAKANYTISSKKWDATNLGLFSGNDKDFWTITKPVFEEVERLKAKELIVTECGHAFRSCRMGYRNFWEKESDLKFPIRHILQLMAEWIKEGRIKLDPDKITETVTYHDPCNTARKEGVYEEPRYVINSFIKNFNEMYPNKQWNICCGGGGGALAMPEYKVQRLAKGRLKADQIVKTGAKIIIVPCHNCMDQFNDINKEFKLGVKNEHLCALIAEALILD